MACERGDVKGGEETNSLMILLTRYDSLIISRMGGEGSWLLAASDGRLLPIEGTPLEEAVLDEVIDDLLRAGIGLGQ